MPYLLREKDAGLQRWTNYVTQRAGSLGRFGTSSDMADLLARETADPHAAEAVALLCRQAKKFSSASLAGVLGGSRR